MDIAKAATDCSSSSSSSTCLESSLRIHRLLRACATLGVFRMREGDSSSSSSSSSSSHLWEHTPSSLLLRQDHPDTLRDTVLFMGGAQYPSLAIYCNRFGALNAYFRYQAASSLPSVVKTGQSHFHRLYNISAFEWCVFAGKNQNPKPFFIHAYLDRDGLGGRFAQNPKPAAEFDASMVQIGG